VPYRERFERLISTKTFRDELTQFHCGADAGVIQTAHREKLIPILIAVLLPKLLNRKHTATKV